MDRKRTKEFLPLITAFAEGKIIQVNRNGVWEDEEYPHFDVAYSDYRIKPTEEYIVYSECYNANKCYLLSPKDPINTSYRERFRGTKEECQKWIDEHTVKYRPYKDCNEMIDDYKRIHCIVNNEDVMPLIWVKDNNAKSLITDFGVDGDDYLVCLGASDYDMKTLFNDFTYLDGSPIGVKE